MKILCIIIINHPSSIIPNCWISLPFCCFDCFCLKATSLSEKSTGLSTMSGLLSAYDTLAMCSEVQLEVECGLDSVGISWPDQYQPHPRWLGFYHPPREFRLSLGWRKEDWPNMFFSRNLLYNLWSLPLRVTHRQRLRTWKHKIQAGLWLG